MDSATQFLLGASIAGAAMGRQLGPRAFLIGGLVATLPDLDSFVPMGNAIDDMTYHRGASHSVLVQTVAAPVIAFVVTRLVRDTRDHWPRLLLTIWLCLVTHSILDSLTTYGTQILWPLEIGPPVALPVVFIIDPAYTSLLLAGVLAAFLLRKRPGGGLRANRALLFLSTLYLATGLVGHAIVRARAEAHPAFADTAVHVQPTPFNILFWQVLGVRDGHYVVGLTSILPACPITAVTRHDRLAEAPAPVAPSDSVRRLEWFTDGFYTYQDRGGAIAIADLRMGFHPDFVFAFDFARRQGDAAVAIEPARVALSRPRQETVGDLLAAASETLDGCGG